MMRRLSDAPNVSALKVAQTSLFRVPQITERVLPFFPVASHDSH
jgi:lipopolysaccharide export system permease protein